MKLSWNNIVLLADAGCVGSLKRFLWFGLCQFFNIQGGLN